MRVLQRKENRSRTLERSALRLVAYAAQLTGKFSFDAALRAGHAALEDGTAWHKMQEIIKAQGPQKGIVPDIDSEDVIGEKIVTHDVESKKRGYVFALDNYAINDLARILGAPFDKQAGLYLHKRVKEKVQVGEKLFTLYAENEERLKLAHQALSKSEIFDIR